MHVYQVAIAHQFIFSPKVDMSRVHSVLLLCCSCFPVSNGKRPADKLASHHRHIFPLERGGNEPLIDPLSHPLVVLGLRRTSRATRRAPTTNSIPNPTAATTVICK